MVSILTRFDHGIITMILKQDMVYSMICFAGMKPQWIEKIRDTPGE
jgi:hypothetical protein